MNSQIYFAGTAKIGIPKEARVFEMYSAKNGFPTKEELGGLAIPVTMGHQVYVGDNATIYEGSKIGDKCILEDQTRIGFNVKIGENTRIMYSAYICDRVTIGRNCRIAGFICDAAVIEDDCTVMGQLSHKYTISDSAWGDVDEPSPLVQRGSIIGIGAQIVGGIKIGSGTFVCSGAVLTKSTPPNSVVSGFNQIRSIADWSGQDLREFFLRRGDSGNS